MASSLATQPFGGASIVLEDSRIELITLENQRGMDSNNFTEPSISLTLRLSSGVFQGDDVLDDKLAKWLVNPLEILRRSGLQDD
jgi:hypothetical protein